MSAPELKPCPFCGGEARTEERLNYSFYTGCDNSNCGAYNMIRSADDFDAIETAHKKWNTRFPDPEITTLKHEVERLRDALDTIFAITKEAPELNMLNYSEDEVSQLNQSMIIIFTQTQSALEKHHES